MSIFENFKSLDIRIGKVVLVEKVPNSSKLLKFIFDLGNEQRQILGGLAEVFPDPSILIGKEMPVLVNIEPRELMGLQSQGMILAADEDGKPVLLHPEKEIPPGSTIR